MGCQELRRRLRRRLQPKQVLGNPDVAPTSICFANGVRCVKKRGSIGLLPLKFYLIVLLILSFFWPGLMPLITIKRLSFIMPMNVNSLR